MYAFASTVRKGLLAGLALGASLMIVPSLEAARVQLISLKCLETEDIFRDELRMKIRVDGKPEFTLRRDMRDGQTWLINQTLLFDAKVLVRLFDHDHFWLFHEDEFLGAVVINPTPGLKTAMFKLDGASYQLTYRVIADDYVLRILDLRAIKTQEFSGDEIRIVIRPDAKAPMTLQKTMKTGQVWHVHKDIAYDAKALVRLFDRDFDGDPADFLGALSVGAAPMGAPTVRTHTFVMGSARYQMTYQLLRK